MATNVAAIALIVVQYWFVSISIVYLNKILMTKEGLSIPAPIFVTWFQCVITCIICIVFGMLGEGARSKGKSTAFVAQFPAAEYKLGTAIQIAPLSLIFVGMITFNNLCLKYVEVSFYNVARSLTICFNVAFTYFLLGQKTSISTSLCLLIVMVGFYIGADGEVNFSLIGTVCGVLSSTFVSLNSIYTKRKLPVVQDNHWKLTFINNANAVMLFTPMILMFESNILIEHVEVMTSMTFWSGMMLAGIFGFFIGIVTVLQIKATSPLTHNMSGTAKAAVQSMMAFYIWGNEATVGAVAGIFLVLGGSLCYTLVKLRESTQRTNLPVHANPAEVRK